MHDMPTISDDVPCKICNNQTELHGCVDANRSCEIHRGARQSLSGVAIYYRRCMNCGFIFTTAFDSWSLADFRERIYNESYAGADPDYASGSRARENAAFTAEFMRRISARRMLDYGGGDGTLAAVLRGQGFDAHSWDPMVGDGSLPAGAASFPLVTAFEVLEHSPTPIATMKQALSMLEYKGRLLFSTLLMDQVPRYATDHWYIAPRNGHISLHTRLSLGNMFSQLGWQVRSFDENLYLAERYPSSLPE
jgi:hypothetical protein